MVLEYWQSPRLTKLHTSLVLFLCEPGALCKQTNLRSQKIGETHGEKLQHMIIVTSLLVCNVCTAIKLTTIYVR